MLHGIFDTIGHLQIITPNEIFMMLGDTCEISWTFKYQMWILFNNRNIAGRGNMSKCGGDLENSDILVQF